MDLMDYLCNNPGLQNTIGLKIMTGLDFKSLLLCRFVNSSWLKFVDNPKFWFLMCVRKGLFKNVKEAWIDLINHVYKNGSNSNFKNISLCLMRMYNLSYHLIQTPLLMASDSGNLNVVKYILTLYDDVSWTQTKYKRTAIILASKNGHADVVKVLAFRTPQPNQENVSGLTACHWAVKNRHIKVIKVLAAFTDICTTRSVCCCPMAKDHLGKSLWCYALENGDVVMQKVLANIESHNFHSNTLK